ncbi:histidine ammonia-lyase [Methylobacterium sp. ME121]|jgi:hypothetical protein|nr:histidine ammonia-lyase [Methylobacterium sp. ME121]
MAVLAQASREPAIQESNRRSRTLKSQRPHPGKGEAFEIEMACEAQQHPSQAIKRPQASSRNPGSGNDIGLS